MGSGSHHAAFLLSPIGNRMDRADTNLALNRLLVILLRSFPMYLTHARPWTHDGDEQALEVLEHIVADQQGLAERISEFILDSGGEVHTGEFPMDYTDRHDLSMQYIVRLAIDYQTRDVAAIKRLVDELRMAPAAKELAEEALGLAKGHLESLQELVKQPA